MDYLRLWEVISHQPFASLDDVACAAAVNDSMGSYALTVVREAQIDELDVLRDAPSLEVGEAFIAKIEALVGSDPVLKRIVRNFTQGAGGVNLGHPAVRAKFADLIGIGGILQAEVDRLLALAEVRISPAEHAGLGRVRPGHVTKARAQFGGGGG